MSEVSPNDQLAMSQNLAWSPNYPLAQRQGSSNVMRVLFNVYKFFAKCEEFHATFHDVRARNSGSSGQAVIMQEVCLDNSCIFTHLMENPALTDQKNSG